MARISARIVSQQALIDEIWGTDSDSAASYTQLRKKYSQDLFPRLFSRAKIAMTDLRKSMAPPHRLRGSNVLVL